MSKYVIIAIVASVLLTIAVISYFLYTRNKKSINNKCNDNTCNTTANKMCTDDLCTRPEPEKVEPVENTTLVNEEESEETD